MKKVFKYSLFLLLSGLLWTSCNKEQIERMPADEDGEYSVTYTIRVADATQTKANAISDIGIDDVVKRLDLYIFYDKGTKPNEHVTYFPQEGDVITHRVKTTSGETSGILALANLDEDTAKHFEGKSLQQLSQKDYSIILSAGNFAFDRIPMIGSSSYYHSEYGNGTAEIVMRRLMTRLNLQQIAIDFIDPTLVGKEVKVKTIAIINAMNYFVPINSPTLSYLGSDYGTFGYLTSTLYDAFGGIEKGCSYRKSHSSIEYDSPIQVSGPGKMNGDFPHLFNRNYKNDPETLIIDAEGIFKEALVQQYDTESGGGLIVPSGDDTQVHTFDVNKCFYTYFWSGGWPETLPCDFKSQAESVKLVIELLIDGEVWFYPIQLKDIQPNMVYNIEKVTIRNTGSKYANFIEKKYRCDFTVSIKPWTTMDINNLFVGADPTTGQPVDPNTGEIVEGQRL